MLAAIKYSGFAISGANYILRAVGTQKQFSLFTIVAPIGISFFTFQAISYIIDIYQGKYACEKISLSLHCLYRFSSDNAGTNWKI